MPAEVAPRPAYLVMDTESVPDGQLLAKVKYAADNLGPADAVARAQSEARATSAHGSDFLPLTFQYPVATCMLRVGEDYSLQKLSCLDAPQFRPRQIVEQFWKGLSYYRRVYQSAFKIVSFNGQGFDLPLLEMAAFRYGVQGREHFQASRRRGDDGHLDLMCWLTNNSFRLSGGLDLLSKLLGKPGKMRVKGDMVYQLYVDGKTQEINDYCMHDTLDTYFIFLRTRVLTGDLTLEQEHIAVLKAKDWIKAQVAEFAGLQQYIDNWGDWNPWP